MPGMTMSVISRSTVLFLTSSRACSPLSAESTSTPGPSWEMARARVVAVLGWSSTTSTRTGDVFVEGWVSIPMIVEDFAPRDGMEWDGKSLGKLADSVGDEAVAGAAHVDQVFRAT